MITFTGAGCTGLLLTAGFDAGSVIGFCSRFAAPICVILDRKSKVPPLATTPLCSGIRTPPTLAPLMTRRTGTLRCRELEEFGKMVEASLIADFSPSFISSSSPSGTSAAKLTAFIFFATGAGTALSLGFAPSIAFVEAASVCSSDSTTCFVPGASDSTDTGASKVASGVTGATGVIGTTGAAGASATFSAAFSDSRASLSCFAFHSSARKSFSETRDHVRAHLNIHSGVTTNTFGVALACTCFWVPRRPGWMTKCVIGKSFITMLGHAPRSTAKRHR